MTCVSVSTVLAAGQTKLVGARLAANDYVLDALKLEPTLRRVLNRYTKHSQDVPDLMQEVYLKLLRWSRDCRVKLRSFDAFAVQVARNVALDSLRKRDTAFIDYLPEPEVLEAMDGDTDMATIVGCEQELECFMQTVNKLPPQCRRVFTLRKIYGFSQKEIASRLGIAENTVERHIVKALRTIAVRAEEFPVSPGWRSAMNRVRHAARD